MGKRAAQVMVSRAGSASRIGVHQPVACRSLAQPRPCLTGRSAPGSFSLARMPRLQQ